MASRTNGYDSSLIKDAPEVTKADKQEGYDIDLLEQGRPKSVDPHGAGRSTRRPPGAAPAATASPYPAQKVYNEKLATPPPKQPFYRTRKGLIIIGAVVFVVILAVGLGAGIGISNRNRNRNSNSTTEGDPNGLASGEGDTNSGKPTLPSIAPTNTRPGDPGATTKPPNADPSETQQSGVGDDAGDPQAQGPSEGDEPTASTTEPPRRPAIKGGLTR